MPIYEYKCKTCGHLFEELVSSKEDKPTLPCRKCSNEAEKKMSTFASVVAGGSTNESPDMIIGREANKRWQRVS